MTWTTRPRSKLGELAAITAGDGPAVLLLHGVGLRAEAWGAQIEALSPKAKVIAPDMPGHGHSPAIGSSPGIEGFVEAASKALDHLDEPTVVVGHSMGAMIALALAVRHHDKVNAVVALNGVFARNQAAAQAVQGRADALDGVSPIDPTRTLIRWFGSTPSSERDACSAWLHAMDPSAYKAAYTAFAHSTVPDAALLRQLSCPSVFMTGADEPNSTPAMSEAMAEYAPRGRAIIVDGAAHMMPMTHPNTVNTVVLQMLIQTSSPERT